MKHDRSIVRTNTQHTARRAPRAHIFSGKAGPQPNQQQLSHDHILMHAIVQARHAASAAAAARLASSHAAKASSPLSSAPCASSVMSCGAASGGRRLNIRGLGSGGSPGLVQGRPTHPPDTTERASREQDPAREGWGGGIVHAAPDEPESPCRARRWTAKCGELFQWPREARPTARCMGTVDLKPT